MPDGADYGYTLEGNADLAALKETGSHLAEVKRQLDVLARSATEEEIIAALGDASGLWEFLIPAAWYELLQLVIGSIVVSPDKIKLVLRVEGLKQLAEEMAVDGIVIASGDIPGIMDEYGVRIADHPFALESNKRSCRHKYEKGEIHFFPSVSQSMFAISASAAPKQFGSENRNLQFCMREKNGVRYLYAVNCSEDIQHATLFARGRFKKVTDRGLQLPLDLKTTIKNNYTYFNTRLAPGEGTLFELHRENP